jgi:hypothetical protein
MPINENSVYTVRFNMVGTPAWRAQLQALASDTRTKESEIVRRLVEQAYSERFGKKKPGAPVPKYNSREGIAAKKARKK